MMLADTSVWIGHLRSGDTELSAVLENGLVVMHPFIAGELACGNLARREVFLSELSALPSAVVATDDEVRHFVEKRRLWGRGARVGGCAPPGFGVFVAVPFVNAGSCIAQSRGGIGCAWR
jgi:predicted nucleic acid-binding protein